MIAKPNFLSLAQNTKKAKTDINHIVIGNSHITPSNEARNLGFIINSDMSHKLQISSTLKAVYCQIRNIGKIRKYLTKDAAQLITHSLVISRLDMCNSLIYGIPHHQLHRLQLAQNTAACIITLTKKRSHITPVLIDLHWLPVKQRIEFKLLIFVFKSLHGSAPSYLSANLHLLQEPRSNNSFGDRSFAICTPKLWNHLPTNIKNCSTLSTFKTALKTHLFASTSVNDL